MNEQQTLKKLASLFHIAPSALRYWDKEGLIRFERSEENNYRYPTWKTMLDICDVLLNRSLSIPVKSMRELPKMSVGQQLQLLDDSEEKLLNQIKEIQTMIESIHHKKALLEEAIKFDAYKEIVLIETQLPAIRSFTFENKEDMELFIYDPSCSAILLDAKNECSYGLFTDNPKDILFRDKDQDKRYYLKGLLKINTEDSSMNNANQFYMEANKRKLKAGSIIGRYLVTAYDQKRYDYYEAWLEILVE